MDALHQVMQPIESQEQENRCLWCGEPIPSYKKYCNCAHKQRAYRARKKAIVVHLCRLCGQPAPGRSWYCSTKHKWQYHMLQKKAGKAALTDIR